jgi:outer membrane protein assembly factor BamE (lipoprotein component of BamABCDE complex)
MKTQAWALVVFSCAFVVIISGCATGKSYRGRPIAQNRVEQIEMGKTTMDQIIHWFGSPTEKYEMGGQWMYTYKHTKITHRGTFLPYFSDRQDIERSDELTVKFDGNGVVQTFHMTRGI